MKTLPLALLLSGCCAPDIAYHPATRQPWLNTPSSVFTISINRYGTPEIHTQVKVGHDRGGVYYVTDETETGPSEKIYPPSNITLLNQP